MASSLPSGTRHGLNLDTLDLRHSIHGGSRLQILSRCLDDQHLMRGAMSEPELRGMALEFRRLGDAEFRQVCVLLKNRLATLTLNDELIAILSRAARSTMPHPNVPLRIPRSAPQLSSTIASYQGSLAQLHEQVEQRCNQLTTVLTNEYARRFPSEPAPFAHEQDTLFGQRVNRHAEEKDLHELFNFQAAMQRSITALFGDAELAQLRAKDSALDASMKHAERHRAILEHALREKEGPNYEPAKN